MENLNQAETLIETPVDTPVEPIFMEGYNITIPMTKSQKGFITKYGVVAGTHYNVVEEARKHFFKAGFNNNLTKTNFDDLPGKKASWALESEVIGMSLKKFMIDMAEYFTQGWGLSEVETAEVNAKVEKFLIKHGAIPMPVVEPVEIEVQDFLAKGAETADAEATEKPKTKKGRKAKKVEAVEEAEAKQAEDVIQDDAPQAETKTFDVLDSEVADV